MQSRESRRRRRRNSEIVGNQTVLLQSDGILSPQPRARFFHCRAASLFGGALGFGFVFTLIHTTSDTGRRSTIAACSNSYSGGSRRMTKQRQAFHEAGFLRVCALCRIRFHKSCPAGRNRSSSGGFITLANALPVAVAAAAAHSRQSTFCLFSPLQQQQQQPGLVTHWNR